MSLFKQIQTDKLSALKQRDADRLSVLRMLDAALQNAAIDKKGDLDDQEVTKILKNQAKKRQEAADAFKQAGRDEQAAAELAELEIIEEYLPEQMSQEDLEQLVDKVLQENEIQHMSQFGQAMGKIMQQVDGRADGSQVQEIVKQKLK